MAQLPILIQAIVLGIVQGLTEFIPVSSTAHLKIVPQLFGWQAFAENQAFDVSLHLGTLLALLAVFWPDVVRLWQGFWGSVIARRIDTDDRRLAWFVLVTAVPGAIAGVLLEKYVETVFGTLPYMTAAIIGFALIMWASDYLGRKNRSMESLNWLDAVLVGCSQALALFPGVSRSGITMVAGICRGMTRETAARFSFLASIPLIAGAVLYEGWKLHTQPDLMQGLLGAYAAGIAASLVVGYLSIRFLLNFLKTNTFFPFVAYRLALGALLIWWLYHGGRMS